MASEVDPQVKAFLEQSQANGAQQSVPVNVDEKIAAVRQHMRDLALIGIAREEVSKCEDFDIPGPGGKIRVRLYVPQAEEVLPESLPALVYYHGGGFIAGGLDSHDTLLRALANRARTIVVSVDYRLAPEHPYPAAYDDAYAALAWVADHGSEFGGDAQRIAIGGDSAGGCIAAWVGQKAKKQGQALRLQVLLYPITDATASQPSWGKLGDGAYLISQADGKVWYDSYLPQGINAEDPAVSPLFATDLTGIAPALIVTAEYDPLVDEGDAYAEKLKAANVPVEHTRWPGMIHGFASMAGVLDAGKVVIDQIAAALRKALQ